MDDCITLRCIFWSLQRSDPRPMGEPGRDWLKVVVAFGDSLVPFFCNSKCLNDVWNVVSTLQRFDEVTLTLDCYVDSGAPKFSIISVSI